MGIPIKFSWKMRKNRGCLPNVLPDVSIFLFFTLIYLKNNPLQEYHGASFGMSQEVVSVMINKGLKALQRTLTKMGFRPCRDGGYFENFRSKGTDNDDDGEDSNHFYVDASDTHINRPREKEEQKSQYSGKHKTHGIKNTFVSDEKAKILYLGPTTKGSVHDKKMVDEEAIKFPKQSYLFFDLGYLGFLPKDAIIFMPHKKPKNEELTKEQKFENYLISGVRITVEHTIGGVKRCRIMLERMRIYAREKRDRVIEICNSLHNLRVHFRNERKLHPIYRAVGLSIKSTIITWSSYVNRKRNG
jgi:hypothetical protein